MKRMIAAAGVVLIALLIGLPGSAGATDFSAIKARMKERLPVIKSLKVQGIVGENNRGYIELLKDAPSRADVVEAENRDRRAVYEAIARQENTDLEVVEKHRAAQIERKAASGEWLQDATGKWYRKP